MKNRHKYRVICAIVKKTNIVHGMILILVDPATLDIILPTIAL